MICAVATKTTGLKRELHEVIELAIQPVDSSNMAVYKIKPERPEIYEKNVQDINGISAGVASSFTPKEEASTMILNTWQNIIVLGHNCIFDFEMLQGTFGDSFIKKFYGSDFIDTMGMAHDLDMKRLKRGDKKLFKNHRLKHVCEVLKVPFQHKCTALIGVYNALKNASDS